MEYSPPPLFKQGPSAFARLIVFVTLALVLLVSDVRYRALEKLHQVIGTALYPLQQIALLPRDIALGIVDFFVTGSTLRAENQTLKTHNLALTLQTLKTTQLAEENEHLRSLLALAGRVKIGAVAAEIRYDAQDPFVQKIIIDRGSRHGIRAGSPVINENGVLGQVTRVYPLQSEATLLTDKDLAIPVQFTRTGLRGLIYGTSQDDFLNMRFISANADVQPGDELVTSGLDGVFPPGLPVAKVFKIERPAGGEFADVVCKPATPVRGANQLLVLHYQDPPLVAPASSSTTKTVPQTNKKSPPPALQKRRP